jgi:hypothetical protein
LWTTAGPAATFAAGAVFAGLAATGLVMRRSGPTEHRRR